MISEEKTKLTLLIKQWGWIYVNLTVKSTVNLFGGNWRQISKIASTSAKFEFGWIFFGIVLGYYIKKLTVPQVTLSDWFWVHFMSLTKARRSWNAMNCFCFYLQYVLDVDSCSPRKIFSPFFLTLCFCFFICCSFTFDTMARKKTRFILVFFFTASSEQLMKQKGLESKPPNHFTNFFFFFSFVVLLSSL